jgi:hypothetical protein
MSFYFSDLQPVFCMSRPSLVYMLCAARFFLLRPALPLGICSEFISFSTSRKRRGDSLVNNLSISPLKLLMIL